MVRQFTLEKGKAPANHSYCESIIKHLKQKLGFITHQVAAVPEDYCKDQDWEEAPLDPRKAWNGDIQHGEGKPVAAVTQVTENKDNQDHITSIARTVVPLST